MLSVFFTAKKQKKSTKTILCLKIFTKRIRDKKNLMSKEKLPAWDI